MYLLLYFCQQILTTQSSAQHFQNQQRFCDSGIFGVYPLSAIIVPRPVEHRRGTLFSFDFDFASVKFCLWQILFQFQLLYIRVHVLDSCALTLEKRALMRGFVQLSSFSSWSCSLNYHHHLSKNSCQIVFNLIS